MIFGQAAVAISVVGFSIVVVIGLFILSQIQSSLGLEGIAAATQTKTNDSFGGGFEALKLLSLGVIVLAGAAFISIVAGIGRGEKIDYSDEDNDDEDEDDEGYWECIHCGKEFEEEEEFDEHLIECRKEHGIVTKEEITKMEIVEEKPKVIKPKKTKKPRKKKDYLETV